MPKPHGVCWCDCHTPVDEQGRRRLVNEWPRFDDSVGIATACARCKGDHDLFVATGLDWHCDKVKR